jgi:hypothetical protein
MPSVADHCPKMARSASKVQNVRRKLLGYSLIDSKSRTLYACPRIFEFNTSRLSHTPMIQGTRMLPRLL